MSKSLERCDMDDLLLVIYRVGGYAVKNFIPQEKWSLHIIRDSSLDIMEDQLISQHDFLEIDDHILSNTTISKLTINRAEEILFREESFGI